MRSRTFFASLDVLYDMLKFVISHAKNAGFESHHVWRIELATEEALVNIIRFSYPNTNGDIVLTCVVVSQGLKIIIQDNGIPFNPIEAAKKFKFLQSLEDPYEGIGVFLISKLMDDIIYERKGTSNCLTLFKYLQ
jgi:anti-sigma regulatory factor (Ser/Thr protein kinase)